MQDWNIVVADDAIASDICPYGAITIEETEPIVAVTVIGSGCSNHAHVVLEAKPLVWKYSRMDANLRFSWLNSHTEGFILCSIRGLVFL